MQPADRSAEGRRRVAQLPDDLANKIAAGEVVVRPASVVKELLDNAVDALARSIDVEIGVGGTDLIRVVDDGHGMPPDDARLALRRHATSKIQSAADLDAITTLGFRGEALPSIAAVSKLTLRTRVAEEDAGLELRLEGGKLTVDRPCGCPVGTTVEAADVFFNVPARRKFLRSVTTEAAHVSSVVRAAALAYPELRLTLTRDGRVSRRYPQTSGRAERVADVLQEKELWHCAADRGPLSIEAFLSPPERARQGAGGLHLFVNGRAITDRAITRAIASAYGDSLDRSCFPRGAVYLALSPDLVDVNVHPQKAEVRFADARAVTDAVFATVSAELAARLSRTTAATQAPQFWRGPSKPQPSRAEGASWWGSGKLGQIASPAGTPAAATGPQDLRSAQHAHAVLTAAGLTAAGLTAAGQTAAGPSTGTMPNPAAGAAASAPPARQQDARPAAAEAASSSATAPPAKEAASAPLEGQRENAAAGELYAVLRDRYLLGSWQNEVLVLDARRAQRQWLEELGERRLGSGLASQRLMFPQVRRVPPAAYAALEANERWLGRLGFDVRPAGSGSAMLHAVPKLFGELNPDGMMEVLWDALAESALDEARCRSVLKKLCQLAVQTAASAAVQREVWRWLVARAERDGRAAFIGLLGAVTLPRDPDTA